MIDEKRAKKYCYEDISLIENYDKAVADKTQTWHCHHRWETDRGLSEKELEFCSEYYYVPADRLIFLTNSEHSQLHRKGKHHTAEAKQKIREAHIGKKLSAEHKQKLSEAHRKENLSEEIRRKMSEAQRGKKFSAEHKQKLSEARLGRHWWTDGRQNKFTFECPGPEWKQGRTSKTKGN